MNIKIFLMSLIYLTFTLEALEYNDLSISKNYREIIIYHNGAKDFNGENQNNWVGLYKKGTSNDLKNAIIWKWAKDLFDTRLKDGKFFHLGYRSNGDYELRFFKNNSYQVFKKFQVTINHEKVREFKKTYQSESEIQFEIPQSDGKTWVGIYKKGASNELSNALIWQWATWTYKRMYINILENGVYEARLFFNNSYNVESTIEFTVDADHDDDNVFYSAINYYTGAKDFKISTRYYGLNKPWIGVFKVGAEHTRENLIAWSYPTQPLIFLHKELFVQGATFEVGLFIENKYKRFGKTAKLIVDLIDKNSYPVTINSAGDREYLLTFDNYNNRNDKDWIGVFRKGEALKRENLVAWSYVKLEEGRDRPKEYMDFNEIQRKIQQEAPYPEQVNIILFSKDSYNILGVR